MDTVGMRQSPRNGVMQTALLLVLGTETALFVTLVMTYLFMRSGGSTWTFTPPTSLDTAIAGANTLVLLASAVIVRSAHRAIQRDRTGLLEVLLLIAFVLGGIFVAGQIFEFRHSGLSLRDFSFGAAFFALISFHAAHVLAGMVFLGLNLARAHAGDFNARRHTAITAGTWFWYFVTGVWVVLFAVLYLI
jgi:heme/copper-type cytochrome/quinol oxidase subunit 3